MGTVEKATREVDDCRCLLKGMAKNLADRCYGPDGPTWGTPFSAVEDVALSLADTVRKVFLDLALSRQANAFREKPPASLCLCPTCSRPTSAKDPEPRLLFCRAATVEWLEPQLYCSKCRKAFFPQSKSLGLDLGHYSPSLLGLVCYAGANKPSFREASIDLDKFSNLAVHEKQVERLTKRIGSVRVAERDEQVRAFCALPLSQRKDGGPDGVAAPDCQHVAVVMADAGMMQMRAEPTDQAEQLPDGSSDSPQATRQADGFAATESDDDPDQQKAPGGRHWHEDKVGLVLTMRSGVCQNDPCVDIPDTFIDAERVAAIVKGLKKSAALQAQDEQSQQPEEAAESKATEKAEYEGPKLIQRQVVASRQAWPVFGALLACAAYTAGFARASRKAFVADGAKAIWGVWQAHFSAYVPILDFIHAMSYVYEAARAVGGDEAGGWKLYAQWITWVWQGGVARVIEKLQEWQFSNGQPEKGEAKTTARSVVGRAVGYLLNNKERMKYDEYRKQGLPIVSSLVESMVKQISRRVKGTEKFWTKQGAEAVLQLRADYLSDGDPMGQFFQRRQDNATGQRSYKTNS